MATSDFLKDSIESTNGHNGHLESASDLSDPAGTASDQEVPKISELSNESPANTEAVVIPPREPAIAPVQESKAPSPKKSRRRLNLRTKATLLAIAIGTLPVVATGTLAYFLTSPEIQRQAVEKQEARASEASELASTRWHK